MKAWGVVAAALVLVTGASGAAGSGARTALRLTVFASGFSAPVHVAAPRNEPGKLYVVEQRGTIQVLVNGKKRAKPFLDIRRLVRSGGEQGLLSVAFHPEYAKNRRFYVNYTDRNGIGNTQVVEYRSNGTSAIPSTARRLLNVTQPYVNHNGGQLAFGPAGRLYVGMGDGGSGGDPQNNAQDMKSRLGKLLSIDVATKGPWKIEALGLRNPWRFSFDRETGDLYIGDVGQDTWEEIDFLPSTSRKLVNFGWNAKEGRSNFPRGSRLGEGRYVGPVAQYGRSLGLSVTGGFVYRGKAVPAAVGRYFYGDYGSGRIWSLKMSGGKARTIRKESFRVANLSSFGEDAAGELYAASWSGTIYRLR